MYEYSIPLASKPNCPVLLLHVMYTQWIFTTRELMKFTTLGRSSVYLLYGDHHALHAVRLQVAAKVHIYVH